MTKYFRVTAYCKEHDFSFIMDTNGLYEKLWELSAELIKNGMSIIEASSEEKFLDVNIEKVYDEPKQMILRATAKGKPETVIIITALCEKRRVAVVYPTHKKSLLPKPAR